MTPSSLSQVILRSVAAVSPTSDSAATARLLYHANWLPLNPAWLARFPADDAAIQYVTGKAGLEDTLAGRWWRTRDASWVHWQDTRRSSPAGPYKVYVGVRPDDLPGAFDRCLAVFGQLGTRSFKLARTPRGLLRPDRLVAYTATVHETERLMDALDDALTTCRPQEVPFTAGADRSVVSWARDPRGEAAGYGASWRSWVTRKLAAYLHASDAPNAAGRAEFARSRLEQDGVDTNLWRWHARRESA